MAFSTSTGYRGSSDGRNIGIGVETIDEHAILVQAKAESMHLHWLHQLVPVSLPDQPLSTISPPVKIHLSPSSAFLSSDVAVGVTDGSDIEDELELGGEIPLGADPQADSDNRIQATMTSVLIKIVCHIFDQSAPYRILLRYAKSLDLY